MKKIRLTHARLLELLDYDPDTGIFVRIKSQSYKSRIGKPIKCLDNYGYIQMNLDSEHHKGHRLAWFFVNASWPLGDIDHINGNRSDNRIANLRCVSRSVNLQNQSKAHPDSKTGFLGVSKCGNKFESRIYHNKRVIHLGYFYTPQEAHNAYLKAKERLHSGFVPENFSDAVAKSATAPKQQTAQAAAQQKAN